MSIVSFAIYKQNSTVSREFGTVGILQQEFITCLVIDRVLETIYSVKLLAAVLLRFVKDVKIVQMRKCDLRFAFGESFHS